jgi:hypothetical protein
VVAVIDNDEAGKVAQFAKIIAVIQLILMRNCTQSPRLENSQRVGKVTV